METYRPSHVLDPSIHVRHLYDVSRLDGFIGKENEAAHEIAHDFLKPETDTHADGAAEKGQGGQIDSHAVQEPPG